jgi:Ca-activated chloride channel family protein
MNNHVTPRILTWLLVCALLLATAEGARSQSPGQSVEKLRILRVSSVNHPCTMAAVVAFTGGQNPRPVKGLLARDLLLTEDGKAQALRRFAELKPEDFPLAVVLVLDISASMVDPTQNAGALDDAKEAAVKFVDRLKDRDQVALVTISTTSTLARGLGPADDGIKDLIYAQQGDGMTDLYGAVHQAVDQLDIDKSACFPVVVLMTDGSDTAERADRTRATSIAAARMGAIPLYCVGLGQQVDVEALRAMAEETGGYFFNPSSSTELGGIYEQILAELSSIYLVGYRSNQWIASGRPVTLGVSCGSGSDTYLFQGQSTLVCRFLTFVPASLLGLFFLWSFLRLLLGRR